MFYSLFLEETVDFSLLHALRFSFWLFFLNQYSQRKRAHYEYGRVDDVQIYTVVQEVDSLMSINEILL